MALAQSSLGGVVHDQEWNNVGHSKIECSHNMRMDQLCYHACFFVEMFGGIFVCQLGMKDFDSSLSAEVNMLSKIDFGESSSPQLLNEAIVAELLSYAVGHGLTPMESV